MENETYLSDLVGQSEVKKRLLIYKKSFEKKNQLPFILFSASRGAGKTKFIREFRQTLRKSDGCTPPIMEVNGAAIKSADSFFDQIYPVWDQNQAVLFIDEVHEIPDKLAQILLTVLEKDSNPVRRVTFEHREQGPIDYTFDFRRISFVCATTDHQKLPKPLLDRLTQVSLGEYSKEDLFEIFLLNLNCKVSDHIHEDIKRVFRGHPRACVELAEELDHYASAHGITYINLDHWRDFCNTMGIHPYGLNNAEMQIIKVLGERRSCSLNAIAAATGFSKQVIQQEYEYALLHKGLIDIDGKRMLTSKGTNLYLSEFVRNEEEAVPEPVVEQAPVTTVETPVERVMRITEQSTGEGNHPLYRR